MERSRRTKPPRRRSTTAGPPDGAGRAAFPAVAIGASAGGVEAFRRLLRSLAPDTGMAFVLIQHLDPRQPSHLTQSLSTATTMKVIEIENGTRLAPDQVFVVPPAMDVS